MELNTQPSIELTPKPGMINKQTLEPIDIGPDIHGTTGPLYWVLRLSGLLVLLAGAATATITLLLIGKSYSPTPFSDQWTLIDDLAAGVHWWSFSWLWHQHNEHRIPLARLSVVADLKLFGGHSILLFGLVVLVLVAHWAIWAAFLRKAIAAPAYLWFSLAGWFAFCIFCPSQNENFYWGFQWNFMAAFVLASVSFLSLVWLESQMRPWRAVTISSMTAFLSECCLANGLLVWPVLLFCSFFLPLSRRHRTILFLIAGSSILLYVAGYHSPVYHSNPLQSIRQPGRIFQFLLAYFGHCLATYTAFPEAVTVLFTVLAGCALWVLLRTSETRTVGLGLASAMAFAVGTAIVTALGRLKFGAVQGEASRYQTGVMLYWGCAFAALILAAWKLRSWRDVLTLNGLAFAMIVLPNAEIKPLFQILEQRAAVLSLIGESLDQGVQDPTTQTNMVVEPSAVQIAVSYLHRIGELAGPAPASVSNTILQSNGRNPLACEGRFDSLVPVDRFYSGPKELRAEGWAINLQSPHPPGLFVIGDQDGKVLATSRFYIERIALPPAKNKADARVQWRLYVPIQEGTEALHAYTIIDGHACEIGAMQVPVK
jgi:hypothetical protein